ncbi:DUF5719 family protein [Nocardioides sp.]|uniref:DUF5719 family protein n=1 Tax=Nocardioides sp. TaxID=35761 RepID=UPI0039E6D1FE
MSTPTPGRRAATRPRRRLDVTTLLALALPLVVAAVLAVVRPDTAGVAQHAPRSVALDRLTLACPSALDGKEAAQTELGVTAPAAGSVTVGDTAVEVGADAVTSAPAPNAPTAVTGTGDEAVGLVAALWSTSPATGYDCAPPLADQWFTGVGAGPTHASVLELVNPHPGPAVVDVDVLTDTGPLEVDDLRGITVNGHDSRQIDLSQVVPRDGVMALHAVVARGQVGIAVRDRGERLTGGVSTEDWLPAQAAPATTDLMLGVQPGSGRHTLAIANGGDDQVSASLKLVTADSEFAPADTDPIDVPPHSIVSVVLDEVLGDPVAQDAVGLEVDASGPVTTALRSVVDGDLSILVPGGTVTGETTAIVPAGAKRLILAGADAVGVATVTARDATGASLGEERVSLAPDKAGLYDIPEGAASVEVSPARTGLQGAVLATDGGSAVVRLRELPRTTPVPAVAQSRS